MKSRKTQLSHAQNFLRDRMLVRALLAQTSIDERDLVYEIGPGKGILTDELSRTCREVVAIEYDARLYRLLQRRFAGATNVRLKHGDALQEPLPPDKPYKVFSNIPFDISAQILAKLTLAPNPPADAYLVVQRETALKYSGAPHGPERLRSLSLKPWFEPQLLHEFRAEDFVPIPSVGAVLMRIRRRETPLVPKQFESRYRDFAAYVFSRSGPLSTRLKKVLTRTQLTRLARDLHFEPEGSPDTLRLDQWLEIFRYFEGNVVENKKLLTQGCHEKLTREQAGLRKIHRSRR